MNKCLTAIVVLAVLLYSAAPAMAAEDGGGFFTPIINSFIDAITSIIKAPFDYLGEKIIIFLADWLAKTPRPADKAALAEMWSDLFDIYLTQLLPLSLVLLAIYIMFSSDPPHWVVFESYMKRVAYATFLAYFSFTIIDAFVWLTNALSESILNAMISGKYANIAMAATVWASTLGSVIGAVALSGGALLPFVLLFLFTVLVIIGLKAILPLMVAATMPIFAFFLIIGVGPLRKASELVESLWGLGIILPTLSVLGAVIVGFMIRMSDIATIIKNNVPDPMGVFLLFSPLALVLAFPMFVQSMMGAMGGAMEGVTAMASHAAHTFRPAMMAKWQAAQRFGKLAPLYAMMPSKLAARVHGAMIGGVTALRAAGAGMALYGAGVSELGRGMGKAGVPLRGLGWALERAGGAAQWVAKKAPKELQRDYLASGLANALLKAGVGAGATGIAYRIASKGGADVTNPHAAQALEDISYGAGRALKEAVDSGDMDRVYDLVAALHGEEYARSGGIADAARKVIRENYEMARKLGDPATSDLTKLITLSTGKDGGQAIVDFLKRNPEVADRIRSSRFGMALLGTKGITGEDLLAAARGDVNAAEQISRALKDWNVGISHFNDTYRTLITGENQLAIARALEKDIMDIHSVTDPTERQRKLDELATIVAQATPLNRDEANRLIREAYAPLEAGGSSPDLAAVTALSRALTSYRDRAVEVMSQYAMASTIDTPIGSDEEAAKTLAGFVESGGLLKTSISADEAKRLWQAQMHHAREKVRQMRFREYLSNRVETYRMTVARADPYAMDPYEVSDYRATMRGWSWVSERIGRTPPGYA